MKVIALIAVSGMLLLQLTGAIPQSVVGGLITVGLAFFAAALAVGIHEAWTKKRGLPGWIVNIVVSLVGALVAVLLGDMVFGTILSDGSRSVAAIGGLRASVAFGAMMIVTLLGARGALWVVNRSR